MKKRKNLFIDEIMAIDDEEELEVYDFVIPENHCFFANSVLVHNSGDIEYASDVVCFLHRQKQELNADLIIAKNRNGKNGLVRLIWIPEKITYGNYEWREE